MSSDSDIDPLPMKDERESLSFDQQMCVTKQCLLNKPHKWDYKFLIMRDYQGLAYSFEIYFGMENNPELRYPDEPELGVSSNTVN